MPTYIILLRYTQPGLRRIKDLVQTFGPVQVQDGMSQFSCWIGFQNPRCWQLWSIALFGPCAPIHCEPHRNADCDTKS